MEIKVKDLKDLSLKELSCMKVKESAVDRTTTDCNKTISQELYHSFE